MKHLRDPTPCHREVDGVSVAGAQFSVPLSLKKKKKRPLKGESPAMIKNYITRKRPFVNLIRRRNVKNPII